MVEVSEAFQEPKFQSRCHDLLFHCRFLFAFLFVIFQANCEVDYLQFFMFYNMVDCSYQHY